MNTGNQPIASAKTKEFSMQEMNAHGVLTPYRLATELHDSDSVVQPRVTVQSIREANEKKEEKAQTETRTTKEG